VPPDGHTKPLSAADVAGAASLTRSGAERRARTTMVAILATAQNGTSGVLAESKHAGCRATWATPRTGVGRHFKRCEIESPTRWVA
jgi:hypothetical protein